MGVGWGTEGPWVVGVEGARNRWWTQSWPAPYRMSSRSGARAGLAEVSQRHSLWL